MSIVNVAQTDTGKWKVMYNYLQEGINFTDKDLANNEALKIAERYHAQTIVLA